MSSKPRVVLSLIIEHQEYQQYQAREARVAAERLGFDLSVVFADGSAVQQAQQLYHCMQAPSSERPVAMIVEPVHPEGLERLVRTAAESGISLIILSANVPYLDELDRTYPKLLFTHAIADDREIGRIQARQFHALLPNGGSIVYVEGLSLTSPARLRREAAKEGIRDSNIEIIRTLSADWTEEAAARVATEWSRLYGNSSLRPDLWGVQNDTMATGVINAIKATRPEWLPIIVTGVDGLPDSGRRFVDEGVLAATIIKPIATPVALEMISQFLNGGRVRPRILAPESYPPLNALTPKRG